MAIRIMDSIKTANDTTDFPVSYAKDVWLNKDKSGATEDYSDLQTMYNNDELGNGGSAIQVDLLPHPSVDELGKIYEFIGSTGTYVNGYFYECVSDEQNPPTYSWVQKNVQPNAESFTFNEDDFNIDSSTDKVSLLPSRRVFNGSKADWDLLSVAEKTQYGATAFTDDEGVNFPLTSEAIQLISGVDANLARVIRYGKLVIIALDNLTATSTIQQYTTIASGLPVPYTGTSEAGQKVASGRINSSSYLYVSASGTLCVGVGGWDGSRGDGSIVYVTND